MAAGYGSSDVALAASSCMMVNLQYHYLQGFVRCRALQYEQVRTRHWLHVDAERHGVKSTGALHGLRRIRDDLGLFRRSISFKGFPLGG